jgi:peptidoglycan/LPS O-acetylase OafA/YrhL
MIIANCRLYLLGTEHANPLRVWADSFVQFECFAAGLLLCLLLRGKLPRIGVWRRLTLLAGGCFCWFIASYRLQSPFSAGQGNPSSWHLIIGYALGSLGATLILIGFLGADPKRLPGWAVYLGRISFGLYVFHELAAGIVFSVFPRTSSYHALLFPLELGVALGLTIAFAAISYHFLEAPFLRIKRHHATIASRPV